MTGAQTTAEGGNATDQRFAIVMPVYEDREASARLLKELFAEYGNRPYVVIVDDGSLHQPVQLQVLKDTGLSGVVIRLKRNVGHQRAIAIGLNYVADLHPDMPCTVVMDSDGEDTPNRFVSSSHRLVRRILMLLLHSAKAALKHFDSRPSILCTKHCSNY